MLETLAMAFSAASMIIAVMASVWLHRCNGCFTGNNIHNIIFSIIIIVFTGWNFIEHMNSINYTEVIITNMFILSAIYINGYRTINKRVEVGVNKRHIDRRKNYNRKLTDRRATR